MEYESLKQQWLARRISAREAAQVLGISHNTFI